MRAKATASLKRSEGAGAKGLVHPLAGVHSPVPSEPDSLEFKLLSDKRVEVQSPGDDVASVHGAGATLDPQPTHQVLVRLQREKVICPL